MSSTYNCSFHTIGPVIEFYSLGNGEDSSYYLFWLFHLGLFCSRENLARLDVFYQDLSYETVEKRRAYDLTQLLSRSYSRLAIYSVSSNSTFINLLSIICMSWMPIIQTKIYGKKMYCYMHKGISHQKFYISSGMPRAVVSKARCKLIWFGS